MTPERAKEIEREINKRLAKARNGARFFRLCRRRNEVEQGFESKIRETGSEDLFLNHEVTRKEDGTWVWTKTRQNQEPTPQPTTDDADDVTDS